MIPGIVHGMSQAIGSTWTPRYHNAVIRLSFLLRYLPITWNIIPILQSEDVLAVVSQSSIKVAKAVPDRRVAFSVPKTVFERTRPHDRQKCG